MWRTGGRDRAGRSHSAAAFAVLAGAIAAGLLSAGPAFAADPAATEVTVDVVGTPTTLTVAPGQYVPGQNVVNLTQSTGSAVPASSGSMTFTITGPAVTGTALPFSVSNSGSRNLAGCSALGGATLTCTNGNPFAMSAGSSVNYNHIRLPFTVSPTALPGDIITITSTFTMNAGFTNLNPDPTGTFTTHVPLTAPTVTSAGTVGPKPTITGQGVPGSTVAVTVAGRPAQTVPVTGAGSWSLTVTTALPSGPASISAVQHRNGFTSTPGTGSVTVDATAPAPPVVDPTDVWTGGTGTLTGTAEPGSVVIVRDAAGTEIGRATADAATGAWSLPVTTPLPGGPNALSAVAEDSFGNVSSPTRFVVDVTDSTPPAAPIVTSPPALAGPTGPISGEAEPGATITIRTPDGAVVGTAIVAADGSWTASLSTRLPAGSTSLAITATDPAGNVSEATAFDVVVPAEPVVAPAPGPGAGGTGPSGTGPQELAFTGSSDTVPAALAGLALVAAGVVLVARRRRA